jgi:hypothetical protein
MKYMTIGAIKTKTKQNKKHLKLDMVVHARNPSTQKAETERMRPVWLQSESLSQKNKQTEKKNHPTK